ncbi:hypothetical protein WOLCODRAFT_134937 [Wolfiporia cocos MD-104 SS10]|uniref:FYVE-type domain-containing protein n=1 Tax=Wolfiporia cocos (strain MD-104) TaxID=742152 RepID=A0A2H3ITT4_WOLCO|nr:hypothetical protein WOLCODRAFT_134937 [Wolfiporia cocos MD-104 SS10]
MNFATVLASRLTSRVPSVHNGRHDESASIASSQESSTPESSSLSSSVDSSACGSAPSHNEPSVTRPNEHLAILLPKRLWKPDAQASVCDVFLCRKKFSIWERRHHCRKCGGIFCQDCSARETTLLDTTHLDFFHPPRRIPITDFESPTSPVVLARVCDYCWDQIHGVRTPKSPSITASTPIAVITDALRDSILSASTSSTTTSPATPLDGSPLRPGLRRTQTSSPQPFASQLRSPARSVEDLLKTSEALIAAVGTVDSNPPPKKPATDFGELEAYPLRYPSHICQKNGGGRWVPKPQINLIGRRLPGEKAPYEIELEREEEERRRRKANPVIIDGDFKIRRPREPEPATPCGPYVLSTF